MGNVHWQLGVGPNHALCGDKDGTCRCLTDCDVCEGARDRVNCPACLAIGERIFENLTYFYRPDGPHKERTMAIKPGSGAA